MFETVKKYILCFLMIVLCVSVSVKFHNFATQKTTECFNLISVNLSDELKGNFVLGTGSIKQNKYFVAYKENEDGSKEYYKMLVDRTKIYDTLEKGSSAYVEIDKDGFGLTLAIRLFVPQNTIKEEINLDLVSEE